jgi:L-threonylcarbamoyladenylate synthase
MVRKKGDSRCTADVSELLNRGGIAILPCDTIYGIVGIYPETESKIRAIKGRGEDKPFLVVIPSIQTLHDFSDAHIDQRVLDFWPGPLTLVVAVRHSVESRGSTIALRCPADPFLLEIMTRTRHCLFSTSVNRTGSPPLWRIQDIVAEFGKEADIIVDSGDMPGGLPSTILDATHKPYSIIRQGGCILPSEILQGGTN